MYVDDVVDALVAMAHLRDAVGRVIDVGTGSLHSVRQVVEMIAELVESSVGTAWGAIDDRPFESERVADISRTRELIGWSPSTDLRTGLAQTVTWYLERQQPAKHATAPA